MSLSNNIQLVKKLSVRKLINAYKVWMSYHVSKARKTSFSIGFPISMAIEPTTSCNLRCPECPSGLRKFTRPIGMLEPVFGGIFAWIFLYEKLSFVQSIGAAVVLVGIYLANRARTSI